MIIELQEVNKHPTKDFLEAIYYFDDGKDIYPTKFKNICRENYKPGKYEIDFPKSTYKNKYGQLTIGNLVLNEV